MGGGGFRDRKSRKEGGVRNLWSEQGVGSLDSEEGGRKSKDCLLFYCFVYLFISSTWSLNYMYLLFLN